MCRRTQGVIDGRRLRYAFGPGRTLLCMLGVRFRRVSSAGSFGAVFQVDKVICGCREGYGWIGSRGGMERGRRIKLGEIGG